MKVKNVIDEDFVNYKKPSMFIACPYCSFKCDKECGRAVCQNSSLAKELVINVSPSVLIDRYLKNPITHAVVFGGLEPFDSWSEVSNFIQIFRYYCDHDIVIYTGYKEDEIQEQLDWLKINEKNIIVKFGRFVPDQESHYDEILGVNLASPNQYAKIFGV